ncbi:hypothetical protein A5695_11955 [Mycobacterium sp. E1747]|nr:hypothetical protein A5695_11955 [Mycobacterium sp. E1747]
MTVVKWAPLTAPARATDVIGVGRDCGAAGHWSTAGPRSSEIVDAQGRLLAKALATYKVG